MMKVRNKSCRERQNAQRKGTGSMISYIKGILEAVEEDMIIVETGGIGYGIRVPLSLLEELPSLGSPVTIHTYFQVREDSMTLYGFLNRQDREMFKQLISVNGIGPRGALGILSVMRPDDLRTAIVSGDAKAISRAPGIGPKTAQRLILDLKDKVDLEEVISGFGGGNGSAVRIEELSGLASAAKEAVEALTALGYTGAEASRAVKRVEMTEGMNSEDVLKASLKFLTFL